MIVITGLDGSGKSTFHNELESTFNSQMAILRLPTMDSEKFKTDPILFKCCQMINELGERGDKETQPGMKIIAMFSAVVLFNDLFQYLKDQKVEVVFCERHPLVDTYIYAKAYHKVMRPSNLSKELAKEIDKKYDLLLVEVIKRLNIDFKDSSAYKSHLLLGFLHDWFSHEANFVPEKLFELFEIKKPDEIYFLDAPAEVLFGRIDDREQIEYHENIAALKKMRSYYLALLPKFGSQMEIVDATNWEAPNFLLDRFRKQFSIVD